MTYPHGVTVTEASTMAPALALKSAAVVGLVATAPAADANKFPLNKPVLIANIETAISDAGVGGTLARSLRAIADHARPIVVVVRIPISAEADAEDAADENTAFAIGTVTEGVRSGMQALLDSKSILGVKPRLIGAPGLENQEVTEALGVLAAKLNAFAYARTVGTTIAASTLYRTNFSARELMLIHGDLTAFDAGEAASVTSFAAARALGLRVRLDAEIGPHKTLSNMPISGVSGVTHPVEWDLMDFNTEAGLLNASDVTAIVRGDAGYKFWGNRTCAADDNFAFESTVRMAQLLRDTVGYGMEWAIDKPLTPSLARDVVEVINSLGRDLVARQWLLGFNCWYDEELNSINSLKMGKLAIRYNYTVPPPLEHLDIIQEQTDTYLANFGQSV